MPSLTVKPFAIFTATGATMVDTSQARDTVGKRLQRPVAPHQGGSRCSG